MLKVDVQSRRGDFDIDAHHEFSTEVTALVGPSGAGKSSLLRLIAGLDRPTGGRVSLKNQTWFDANKSMDIPTHKRQIGMVFQTGLLLTHKSVMENIQLGARGQRVRGDLLVRTGCEKLLDRPVAGLSGGEQQRVMLARALAGKPQVLLLDEPLSALDPQSRTEILDLMATLFPTLDIPVIYVTHAFEEASRLTNDFVRMESGQIMAGGSAAEVLKGTGVSSREQAISSVLEGAVASLAGGGVAIVQVGQQSVEIARGDLGSGDKVYLRLWARDLILAHQKPQGISARNALVGRIEKLSSVSNGQVLVEVLVEGVTVSALVLARTAQEMKLRAKLPIFLIFKSASVEPVQPAMVL